MFFSLRSLFAVAALTIVFVAVIAGVSIKLGVVAINSEAGQKASEAVVEVYEDLTHKTIGEKISDGAEDAWDNTVESFENVASAGKCVYVRKVKDETFTPRAIKCMLK